MDFGSALTRKYDLMASQQKVEARYKLGMLANDQDRVQIEQAKARMAGAQTAADVKLKGAETERASAGAGLAGAQTDAARMSTGLAPGVSASEIARNYASAKAPFMQNDLDVMRLGLGQADMNNKFMWGSGGGFAGGTSLVSHAEAAASPPKPSDTVPAMLTPGEAVLTPQAADILGRPVIDLLNALGAAKAHMGGGLVDMNEGPPMPRETKPAKQTRRKAS